MERTNQIRSALLPCVALFFFACAAEKVELGTTVQAIIECNENTVGFGCDTDNDICTQEVCRRLDEGIFCTLDQVAPDGTSCQSDGLPCTADACISGSCEHNPLETGTLCDDGLFCTTGNACDAQGVCTSGGNTCNDGDECTQDSCDELNDQCLTDVLEGKPCDDGDLCTDNASCDANGLCSSGTAITCDDGDECTENTCDSEVGCEFPVLADSPCADDFFCTIAEACTIDGECQGTLNCQDDNVCTDDTCNEGAQSCNNIPTPGVDCDDGNECTATDSCEADGSCSGSPVEDGSLCGSAGGCLLGGACEAGACTGTTPVEDHTLCDDLDACTLSDSCQSGECEGYPRDCHDGDPCTADGCDAETGCFSVPIPNCGLPADAGTPDAGPGAGPDAGMPDAGPSVTDGGTIPLIGSDADTGLDGILGGGGCQSSGSSQGSAVVCLLMILGLAFRRRIPVLLGVLCGVLLVMPATTLADGFDSEIYKPGSSTSSFLSQGDADVLPAWTLNLGMSLNVAKDPLVLRDPTTGEALMDGVVVSRRTGAYLSAGLGLWDRFELGIVVPFVLEQDGDDALIQDTRDLRSASLGDLRLDAKARLWKSSWLSVAASASATLPAGDDSALFGEAGATLTPRVLLGIHKGRVRLGINAGYRLRRASTVGQLDIGNELTAGAGISVEVLNNRLWILGEGYGNFGEDSAESSPAEALGGLRVTVMGPYQLQAAVGAGIGRGYGTPALRGIFGLVYAPQVSPAAVPLPLLPPPVAPQPPPAPAPQPVPVDTDLDGIFDDDDSCPADAEDKDGYEDSDGCPDLDNDGDTILDLDDACPLEPEVVNGVDDDDGCPDEGIIAMVEDRVTLEETVLFAQNRVRVRRQGRKALRAIITLYNQHPEWGEMRIEGHADTRGPTAFNLALSRRRAERVRDEMVELGLSSDRVSFEGFGESRPLVDGKTDEAMSKNRRVEFVIVNLREEVTKLRSAIGRN